ncbi:ribonuclease P [Pararobbsia silviterrae]|uniref:Ribonuclease P n=1 Tax=Pararobbsia silviterrae TaxID=1792498 RepID=A0A494Y5I2_9BURK|nr:ribonuclease P [Pararobbsia silviterrae]
MIRIPLIFPFSFSAKILYKYTVSAKRSVAGPRAGRTLCRL